MAKCYLVGIDEVGRGSLAGPVTVAAVAASSNAKMEIQNAKLRTILRGIKDSKKLSANQRDGWRKKLETSNSEHKAFFIAHASVGAAIIDKIGISAALRRAVGVCLRKLKLDIKNTGFTLHDSRCMILLDGSLYAPGRHRLQKTIIKGDEKVPLIAAASIVAKVTRDNKMKRLSRKFPKYGFDIHKGYGTASHISAIKTHGLSTLHRRTFCAKINA